MKRIMVISLLILIFLSTGCEKKTDPRLTGTWKSDAEKSMEYNLKHLILTESQIAYFKSIFGHKTLKLAAGTVHEHTPEHLVKLKDKEIKQPESTSESLFTFLGSDSKSVAIKTSDSSGQGGIMLLHFEGDFFWTYAGDSLREYFKKVE